jgi:hypothetical protein
MPTRVLAPVAGLKLPTQGSHSSPGQMKGHVYVLLNERRVQFYFRSFLIYYDIERDCSGHFRRKNGLTQAPLASLTIVIEKRLKKIHILLIIQGAETNCFYFLFYFSIGGEGKILKNPILYSKVVTII